MLLKDLEKLTVVKLRAELTARGLDAKGNKPFLIERLRVALEQEELSGVTHPAIKLCPTEEQAGTGELSAEQETSEMEDEPVSGEVNSDSVSSEVLKVETNGTVVSSEGGIDDQPLPSSNGTPESKETSQPSHVAEILQTNQTAIPIASSEKMHMQEESNLSEASFSNTTPSTADDSIIAVYGGKDDTFMEVSTLEQSEEPSIASSNDQEDDKVNSEVCMASTPCTDPSAEIEKISAEIETNHTENISGTTQDSDLKTESALDSCNDASQINEENGKEDASQINAENGKEDAPQINEENGKEDAPQINEENGKEDPQVANETQPIEGEESTVKEINERGEKRPRESASPSPAVKKHTLKDEGPPPEDEPIWDQTSVVLDWYNSDLNLTIDKSNFLSGSPLTDGGFAFMWAGARASYGFSSGKIFYEVKITEQLPAGHVDEAESNRHVVRIGWSLESANLQLGEDRNSYGFGGTGKISENSQFTDYGKSFQLNDVVGAYLDADGDKDVVELSFAVNGEPLGVAFTIQKGDLNGQALFPHILTKNCRFEVNFGQKEEPWFAPTEGFEWPEKVPLDLRVRGAVAPALRSECQMIMMCGLPGAGKTTWANTFCRENPDKKINILGTNAFLDKMKVNGLARRNNYSGRWEVLIEKCTRCLNILLEVAAKRRRNYILDQTNVYPTAQKRKMSFFVGFQRKAVVIVPTDEDFKVRVEKRIKEEGKDVPDSAVMEMKANFKLPSVDDTFLEVDFPELSREEALKVIEKYSTEAKAAGFGQPPSKRPRHNYGSRGQKNDRDARRHSHGSRDRNRDSRGSNGHSSRTSRSYNRDSRDNRHRPLPPPIPGPNWRGGIAGGVGRGAGRGGWSNRGPPPPMPMPISRNGPYTPRRGPPPPSNRGGWSAPPSDRPPYAGGRAGGSGPRNYDDRRNDRPSYAAPRRDGPSPWLSQSTPSANSAPRNPWNSQPWNNSCTTYGQSPSYNNTSYGGTSNYGGSADSQRSSYVPTGSARATSASYGPSASASRPTSYGPPGPARTPVNYGQVTGSINPWNQPTGYQQHPFNPNHSAYSGGK